ncbi:hypothetical protein P171DRAFT_438177 [Karstenula rhodostoma CBS 690.94]|uniref:Uncharacterized protein n=1 Tax=Karstenula rhodostoma CBS 690.94 TaxID=1392251 RepID=A0A9P4UI89_9PLEO|nr:hypothetical protein P171DRAFT_438177 [Karstenula rhodostoma CBS 690.94]
MASDPIHVDRQASGAPPTGLVKLPKNWIALNVNGIIFRTLESTLYQSPRLEAQLTRWKDCMEYMYDGSYCIDADPEFSASSLVHAATNYIPVFVDRGEGLRSCLVQQGPGGSGLLVFRRFEDMTLSAAKDPAFNTYPVSERFRGRSLENTNLERRFELLSTSSIDTGDTSWRCPKLLPHHEHMDKCREKGCLEGIDFDNDDIDPGTKLPLSLVAQWKVTTFNPSVFHPSLK